jgi:mannosyltransferase
MPVHSLGVISKRTSTMAVALAVIVGAAVRCCWLGSYSLWFDEASTLKFIGLPFREFVHTLWTERGNMTLYYFLMRAWVHVAGQSEVALRIPALFFGVLTIPAIFLLGSRLFNNATGAIASLLLSVHAFHVQWSRETRGYSLLILLLVLAAYLLLRALESGRQRYWIAFAVISAMSVYTHLFAFFVLFAFAVAILTSPYQVSKHTMLLVFMIFEHLSAPMVLFVLLHWGSQLEWIQAPTPDSLFQFLLVITGGSGIVLAAAYGALCALGAFSTLTRERWATGLLLMWLLAPPVLALSISLAVPVFDNKYMVMCVPALTLLAARGCTRLWTIARLPRLVPAAVFVIVLALSTHGTFRYFREMPVSDWRSVVHYVLANQQPADGVVFWKPNVYPYLYYLKDDQAPRILYPPPQWQPMTAELLSSLTQGYRRVWLLLNGETKKAPQDRTLEEVFAPPRFTLESRRVFAGQMPITVALYKSGG